MAQHYFDPEPGAAHRPGTVDLVLPDLHLRLGTDSGVFSPDQVDLGTRILLDTVPPPPPRGRLLDVGCGYGPIALAMARRAPAAAVLGVDVNTRALDLARANAAANGIANARFAAVTDTSDDSDGELDGPFDALWSNPPIRVGKAALHTLLRTWLARLSPGAHAHLVVHRHLGADSLHRWLDAHGHPAERVASRSGYRVLRTGAPEHPPRPPGATCR
ncbi:16S rRNA m(2)G 1207 methyltransferase [Murinocardiopsis flavida]|uniref:16S rRNA m(2)G 1207 methyltransferase n=1 Tax=Murinocardiopsis flavida TaxID=645275 RepID=A0A2P8DP71_9ACTN|nr:methyltransferase [Murinocardiopsis flavida]PSK98993.1 16S rRNA m(2)G 1207 methyltransferase [Murinocardiopsis flavida]